MAHMIDTMAYVGQVPWHGLGFRMPEGASIEEWIENSGLTWTADRKKVAYWDEIADTWTVAEKHRAIVRSDTRRVFSIVSEQYEPVQPRQIAEFFRDMATTHGLSIETLGALKHGAVVWALATNQNQIALGGVDIIKPYLLLSTSYDKTQATRGMFTTVRVVCNNTLQAALGADAKDSVVIPHRSVFDEQEVKAKLGLFDEEMANFATTMEKLVEVQVSPDQAKAWVEKWFGNLDKDTGELTTKSQNVANDVLACIESSPGADMPTAKGTAFGVIQGVTHYLDFHARSRSVDNRLNSAWFGRGAAKKAQAVRDLLEAA